MAEFDRADSSETQLTLAQRVMRPVIWKSAVVAYAVFIFALIAFYIFVAGRSVSYSYTISGQSTVEAGQSAAMRVGVYDIHRAVFLPSTEINIAFKRGKDVRDVFDGVTSPAGLGDVNLTVPDVAPGPAHWVVRLEPVGMSSQTVEIPVGVDAVKAPDPLEPWREAAIVVEKAGKPARVDEGEGPVLIELLAEGNVPVDGLRSQVFVRTTLRDTGAPVTAVVELEMKKGMVQSAAPARVRTNGGGLGFFRFVPIGSQRWGLKTTTTGQDGKAVVSQRTVHLESKPTQYAMILRDPVWSVGERLEVGVLSLHRSGSLYGDIYVGDRWTRGEVTGIGQRGGGFDFVETSVPRPAEGVWLARVQVYGDALQPGEAGDLRYVAVPADGVGREEILRELLSRAGSAGVSEREAKALASSPWLKSAASTELDAQITFWLSELSKSLSQPTLLKDTQQGERDELSIEKEVARGRVTWLLVVSGGLGLVIILFVVVQNFVRVRRQSQLMMEDLRNEGEVEVFDRDFARTAAIFQLVVLFATIALFFTAIVVLLQTL